MGFKIEKPDDLKVKTDERKVIVSFVCFFAYKKLLCKCTDLNVLNLNLQKYSFTKYKKVIENANRKSPKSPIDKMIKEHYQNINTKVNDLFKN